MKTIVLESLFKKVTDLKSCNFIKKRLQYRQFPVNIAKEHYFDKHLQTGSSDQACTKI